MQPFASKVIPAVVESSTVKYPFLVVSAAGQKCNFLQSLKCSDSFFLWALVCTGVQEAEVGGGGWGG